MRDQAIDLQDARIVVGTEHEAAWARLELIDPLGAELASARLGDEQLLAAIEALAMAYAELTGAKPDSAKRGVNRTLRNRARAARERRAGAPAGATTGREETDG